MSGRRVIRRGQQSAHALPTCTSRERSELERLRQSEVAMKAKIRTLEVEVDTLKYRLDGLRKAKNTTIVRREREEIRISSPKLGRHRSSTPTPHPPPTPPPNGCHDNKTSIIIAELKAQVDKLNADLLSEHARHDKLVQELNDGHDKELSLTKQRFEEDIATLHSEMDRLQKGVVKDSVKKKEYDTLLAEVERLRRENGELTEKLDELLTVNQQLRDSNLVLQGKCETLFDDLSVKEARWSQREEELKVEIRKKWGERYQEWMTKAEKKMEELQQVNALLQSMMKTNR